MDIKRYSIFIYPTLHAEGNRAVVKCLKHIPNHETCQTIANAVGESTMVFIAPKPNNKSHFSIAWYNNSQRIKRCGHGTLAAAAFIQKQFNLSAKKIVFDSTYETLAITSGESAYTLSILSQSLIAAAPKTAFQLAKRTSQTTDPQGYYLVELANEELVKAFVFNETLFDVIGQRALIICSQANTQYYDVCFRYFAPQYGVLEDQATGSAGACLWPFWEKIITKDTIRCYQASSAGGYFELSMQDKKVLVTGLVKSLD